MLPLLISTEKKAVVIEEKKNPVSAEVQISEEKHSNKTDPTPLIARIQSISSTGAVIVKFNKAMAIPSMYANVSQRRLEPDYNETID